MGEKQLYGRFKRLMNNISHDKTWTWLKKGNFKRETESLLIAAQYNAVRTNHIKARIDKTQQNSKCRLRGDRNETINHIIRIPDLIIISKKSELVKLSTLLSRLTTE